MLDFPDGRDSVRIAQIDAVKRVQNEFLGHILRRTPTSIDWEGKTH
jgi:hypothetical protein